MCVIVVRLVDGPSAREGRIELYYGGMWANVCGDIGKSFMDTAARVVCYMLGYGYVVNDKHLHGAVTVILPRLPASYITRVSKK